MDQEVGLMERHAVMFTVRPGTEDAVAEILAGYERPVAEIDDETRLLGTTVFMKGNVVVRVMDFEGRLERVMAHLSQQPSVRDVEERLNPYLEVPRDLSSPHGAREFFMRAMMRRITHRTGDSRAAQE